MRSRRPCPFLHRMAQTPFHRELSGHQRRPGRCAAPCHTACAARPHQRYRADPGPASSAHARPGLSYPSRIKTKSRKDFPQRVFFMGSSSNPNQNMRSTFIEDRYEFYSLLRM
jgi:hypothetical protein